MHVTAAHGNLGPAVCTVRDRLAVTRERYRLLEARHQKCLHSPEKGLGMDDERILLPQTLEFAR
jgi:hypothetical protein